MKWAHVTCYTWKAQITKLTVLTWLKLLLLCYRLCMCEKQPRSQTVASSSVLETWMEEKREVHRCQLSQYRDCLSLPDTLAVEEAGRRMEMGKEQESQSKIKWSSCSKKNEVQPRFAFTSFSCFAAVVLEYINMRRKQRLQWRQSLTLNFVKVCFCGCVYQDSSSCFGPCH